MVDLASAWPRDHCSRTAQGSRDRSRAARCAEESDTPTSKGEARQGLPDVSNRQRSTQKNQRERETKRHFVVPCACESCGSDDEETESEREARERRASRRKALNPQP
eukprot:3811538-Rhodomonas_salina.4